MGNEIPERVYRIQGQITRNRHIQRDTLAIAIVRRPMIDVEETCLTYVSVGQHVGDGHARKIRDVAGKWTA